MLDGGDARNIFLKFRLPNETLIQIWNLVDTQRRGKLDQGEFVLAMHLIRSITNRSLPQLPSTLPPGVLDMINAPPSQVGRSASVTSNSSARYSVPDSRRSSEARQPQAPSQQTQFIAQPEWTITPQDRTKFNSIFASLDKSNRGVIGAAEVVPFLTTSNLPEETLAQIWDLADVSSSGKFGKDEFAIAMYLVQQKLMGRELPQTLPASLSLNANQSSPFAIASPQGPQQVAQIPQSPPVPKASVTNNSSLNDLLSLGASLTSPTLPDSPARQLGAGFGGAVSQPPVSRNVHAPTSSQPMSSSGTVASPIATAPPANAFPPAVVSAPVASNSVSSPPAVAQRVTSPSTIPPENNRYSYAPSSPPVAPASRGGPVISSLPFSAPQVTAQQAPVPPVQRSAQFIPIPVPIPVPVPQIGQKTQQVSQPAQMTVQSPPVQKMAVQSPPPQQMQVQSPPPQQAQVAVQSPPPQQRSVQPPPPPMQRQVSVQKKAPPPPQAPAFDEQEHATKLSALSTETSNLTTEVNKMGDESEEAKQKREAAEAKLKDMQDLKSELESRFTTLKSEHDAELEKVKEIEQQIAVTEEEHTKVSTEFSALEDEYHAAQAQHQEVQTQYQELLSQLEFDQQENIALKDKILAVTEETKELTLKLESIQEDAKKQKELIATSTKDLDAAKAESTKVHTQLEAAKSLPISGAVAKEVAGPSLSDQTLAPPVISKAAMPEPAFPQGTSMATPSHSGSSGIPGAVIGATTGAALALGGAALFSHHSEVSTGASTPLDSQDLDNPFHGSYNSSQPDLQYREAPPSFDRDIHEKFNELDATAPSISEIARSSVQGTVDTPNSSPHTSDYQYNVVNAFNLPISRPLSATSSVQNNPPMSVREDLDISRPESPAVAVTSEPVAGIAPPEDMIIRPVDEELPLSPVPVYIPPELPASIPSDELSRIAAADIKPHDVESEPLDKVHRSASTESFEMVSHEETAGFVPQEWQTEKDADESAPVSHAKESSSDGKFVVPAVIAGGAAAMAGLAAASHTTSSSPPPPPASRGILSAKLTEGAISEFAPVKKLSISEDDDTVKKSSVTDLTVEKPSVSEDLELETPTVPKDISVKKPSISEEVSVKTSSIVEDLTVEKPTVLEEVSVKEPSISGDLSVKKPSISEGFTVEKPSISEDHTIEKPSVSVDLPLKKQSVAEDVTLKAPAVSKDLEFEKPSVPEVVAVKKPSIPEDLPTAVAKDSAIEIPDVKESTTVLPEKESSSTSKFVTPAVIAGGAAAVSALAATGLAAVRSPPPPPMSRSVSQGAAALAGTISDAASVKKLSVSEDLPLEKSSISDDLEVVKPVVAAELPVKKPSVSEDLDLEKPSVSEELPLKKPSISEEALKTPSVPEVVKKSEDIPSVIKDIAVDIPNVTESTPGLHSKEVASKEGGSASKFVPAAVIAGGAAALAATGLAAASSPPPPPVSRGISFTQSAGTISDSLSMKKPSVSEETPAITVKDSAVEISDKEVEIEMPKIHEAISVSGPKVLPSASKSSKDDDKEPKEVKDASFSTEKIEVSPKVLTSEDLPVTLAPTSEPIHLAKGDVTPAPIHSASTVSLQGSPTVDKDEGELPASKPVEAAIKASDEDEETSSQKILPIPVPIVSDKSVTSSKAEILEASKAVEDKLESKASTSDVLPKSVLPGALLAGSSGVSVASDASVASIAPTESTAGPSLSTPSETHFTAAESTASIATIASDSTMPLDSAASVASISHVPVPPRSREVQKVTPKVPETFHDAAENQPASRPDTSSADGEGDVFKDAQSEFDDAFESFPAAGTSAWHVRSVAREADSEDEDDDDEDSLSNYDEDEEDEEDEEEEDVEPVQKLPAKPVKSYSISDDFDKAFANAGFAPAEEEVEEAEPVSSKSEVAQSYSTSSANVAENFVSASSTPAALSYTNTPTTGITPQFASPSSVAPASRSLDIQEAHSKHADSIDRKLDTAPVEPAIEDEVKSASEVPVEKTSKELESTLPKIPSEATTSKVAGLPEVSSVEKSDFVPHTDSTSVSVPVPVVAQVEKPSIVSEKSISTPIATDLQRHAPEPIAAELKDASESIPSALKSVPATQATFGAPVSFPTDGATIPNFGQPPSYETKSFNEPEPSQRTVAPMAQKSKDIDAFDAAFDGLDAAGEDMEDEINFGPTPTFDFAKFGSFPSATPATHPFGGAATVFAPEPAPNVFDVLPTDNAPPTTRTGIPVSNEEWDSLFAGFGAADNATASEAEINNAFSPSSFPAPVKPMSPNSKALSELLGMGFDRVKALDALKKNNYNVENASNYLLDH